MHVTTAAVAIISFNIDILYLLRDDQLFFGPIFELPQTSCYDK